MPLWMLWNSGMPSSLDMHFIIMSLVPQQNKMSSIRLYCLHLRAMRSTSVLSSDGGWLSKNILIRCIESYTGPYSQASITIRSCLIASSLNSTALIGCIQPYEGLVSFSTMMSGGSW
jgi:hypothetical protein